MRHSASMSDQPSKKEHDDTYLDTMYTYIHIPEYYVLEF